MLVELVFCLLLAVALLGPDLRAQAMKGRSCWQQAGPGREAGGREVAVGSQEVSV